MPPSTRAIQSALILASACLLSACDGGERAGLVHNLHSGNASSSSKANPAAATGADRQAPAGKGPRQRDARQSALEDAKLEPFIGQWIEITDQPPLSFTVRLTLTDDRRYLATGSIRNQDTDASIDISATGSWAADASAVVLMVESSDSPTIFPPGSPKVYPNSVVDGPTWTYTDTDGETRTLRRDGAASAE